MGEIIKVDNTAKNLGFIFDKNLTMGPQINQVCSQGYGMLRNLWKISKRVTNIDLRTQLVHSGILSRINYCNSLYALLPKSQTKKLQKLINSSARFIYNIKGRHTFEHITPRLKQLHFLPIDYRARFKICLMVYKCINTNSPKYLTRLINFRKPNPNWNLRKDKDNLLLEYNTPHKQQYKNRSFSQIAPVLWNKLPLTIRNSESTESFKTTLKTYFYKQWVD